MRRPSVSRTAVRGAAGAEPAVQRQALKAAARFAAVGRMLVLRASPVPAAWLCALATAALLAVAGRPWGLGVVGWVAFVPLFIVLPRRRTWLAAGALAGTAALGVTSLAYEPAAALGFGWHLFAVLAGALPFALAGAAAWAVARRLPASLQHLTLALFWALAELVPAQPALLGQYALPLGAFGYSQAGLPAMHLARFSSVTATSVALLVANAAFASAAVRLPRRPAGSGRPGMLAPLAQLTVLALIVLFAWLSAPAPSGTAFEVAVVQPNRPSAVLAAARSVPAVRDAVLADLAGLVTQPGSTADGAGPDLIVLPEGAWPHPLPTHDPLLGLPHTAAEALAALPTAIVGAAGRAQDGSPTNSAFLWTDGQLRHAYAKAHLVPIGEAGMAPGAPPVPVLVGLPDGASLLAAPFICYDIVFPATVRQAVRAGAQLLAVLTDDAFAARGDVPQQHLRLARFRAVESGVPLAFASNTGPSALVGAGGALVAVTAVDQATVLRARLGAGVGPTPYVLYGNWVGALTCAVAVVLTVMATLGAAGKGGGVP